MSINLHCDEEDDLFIQTPTDITDEALRVAEQEGWRAGVEVYFQWLRDIYAPTEGESLEDIRDNEDFVEEKIDLVLEAAANYDGLSLYGA